MKLSDYEMPSKKCDLIAEVLAKLAEHEGYIVYHEQQKILDDKDYIKKWRLIKY